jgi:hypothetical protein
MLASRGDAGCLSGCFASAAGIAARCGRRSRWRIANARFERSIEFPRGDSGRCRSHADQHHNNSSCSPAPATPIRPGAALADVAGGGAGDADRANIRLILGHAAGAQAPRRTEARHEAREDQFAPPGAQGDPLRATALRPPGAAKPRERRSAICDARPAGDARLVLNRDNRRRPWPVRGGRRRTGRLRPDGRRGLPGQSRCGRGAGSVALCPQQPRLAAADRDVPGRRHRAGSTRRRHMRRAKPHLRAGRRNLTPATARARTTIDRKSSDSRLRS